MKAGIRKSRTPGDFGLADIPVPTPKAHELLARVAYAGVCASDLDILNDRTTLYRPPVVQGHEYVAIVEEVGKEVRDFAPGDIVVSETAFAIEGCATERLHEDYHLDIHKKILGWTVNGGFAERILLSSHFCHRLKPGTDLKVGALAEPMAIGAESVFVKGRLQPGETVVVIGPGPIGIMCALLARFYGGAKNVYLIGRESDRAVRLSTAKALGIGHCLTTDEPLEDYLLQHNDHKKADLVVDATGHIEGFRCAQRLIKRNGKLVEAGSITQETSFSWEHAAYLSLNLFFVFSSSREAWKIATDFLSTTELDLRPLVTGIYPLEDYQHAFQAAEDTRNHIKVLIQPNATV